MNTKQAQITASKAAKTELMQLSQKAKAFIKNQMLLAKDEAQVLKAASLTVNQVLIHFYKQDTLELKEFKTFAEWKKNGFAVQKGSKAFRVWGSKLKGSKTDSVDMKNIKTGKTESKEMINEFEFWPMCCLFSNKQVEAIEEKAA